MAEGGAGVVTGVVSHVRVANSSLIGNNATSVTTPVGRGGALSVVVPSLAHVSLQRLLFADNNCDKGADIFWTTATTAADGGARRRLAGDQPLHCTDCVHVDAGAKRVLATDPFDVVVARQPTQPLALGTEMRLQGAGVALVLHVVDFYGERAATDRASWCTVGQPPEPRTSVHGGDIGVAAGGTGTNVAAGLGGQISFPNLVVVGEQGATVTLRFTCSIDGYPSSLPPPTAPDVVVSIGRCLPGYAPNSLQKCQACASGTYSPAGAACLR